MGRDKIVLFAAVFQSLIAAAAPALDIAAFTPVHRAKVEPAGANAVRLVSPSAEWNSGLEWKPGAPQDFSSAGFVALDAENLSKDRQARLDMFISDGVMKEDSADHAEPAFKWNRAQHSGIALNPGEKGTIRVPLRHRRLVGAPDGLPGPVSLDTANIFSIELRLHWPHEPETAGLVDMKLSNLRLEGTPQGSVPQTKEKYLPFVDRYGQFAHADWRGKVKSDDDLRGDLAREVEALKGPPPQWDRFGGWKDGPQLAATGHFRVEKVDGKWWFVTPEGHLFFSTGIDVAHVMTDITDGCAHPDWFETPLPESGKLPFTLWNLEKKFGRKDYRDEYFDFMFRRFASWGINTVGCWGEHALLLKARMPYVVCVLERAKGVARMPKYNCYDFDDPGFERGLREAIREKFVSDAAIARAASDPMCVGFFVDNELSFRKWCGEKAKSGAKDADGKIALYFRICREELARAAPGKLYLGCRFAGWRHPKPVWKAAGEYCDVVTINMYAGSIYNVDTRMFENGEVRERPLLIGEFHFGTGERGLFRPSLAPVPDAAAREHAYVRYVEGALQHPLFVGCHWFQYRDQPLLGRGDGEAYGIGFVDVCDRPYPELCRAARHIGETMYDKRANGVWR